MIETVISILEPVIHDLYNGAKKAGASGLRKWNLKSFPTKLARKIHSIENVRTLWKPEGNISLREFFYPPKIVRNEEEISALRLSDLPDKNLIIEGVVGQGKSMFLRSIALEEVLSGGAKRIPIFLELRTISSKIPLPAAIKRQLENYDIDANEETVNYLFKSDKFSLLLDGFDEIEENSIKETLLDIESLVLRYPELRILITTRPNNEVQKSTLFEKISIAPLSPADYPEFLRRLKVSSSKSAAIRKAIQSSPSKIANLVTTPLMLTLVVIVYQSESEIPETLPEFFEKLFQVVFTRHDHLKAAFSRKHHTGLSERRLQTLFEAFCFMSLQLGHSPSLSCDEFSEAFEMALSYTDNCECDQESFKLDITRVACLMLEEGISSYSFIHKSILEYYAAAYIKKLGDEAATLFYSAALEESVRWRQVLVFLKEIDSYRYHRDLLQPLVSGAKHSILDPLQRADDSELVDAVSQLLPDLKVGFSRFNEHDLGLQVSYLGPFSGMTSSDIGMEFIQLLMSATQEMTPKNFAPSHYPNLSACDQASDEPTVPFKLFAINFDVQPLRAAVDIFGARLKDRETFAKKIIDNQNKKKLIFQKK